MTETFGLKRPAFENTQNQMGPHWWKRRARWLRRQRYCQWRPGDDPLDMALPPCGKRATEVDHIVPRFEGGSEDDSNLQSLCHEHHGAKTAAEGRRAWAAKKAALELRFDFTEKHPGYL